MSRPVVTAAPNRVFLRVGAAVIELPPVAARELAELLLEASRTAVSTYDGRWLADTIRSWRKRA